MSKLVAERRTLVAPMLATSSPPFDHPEYIFETKWDGVRALMARQNGKVRIWGRHLQDYTDRYPELHTLPFPDGTILDGELVAVPNGRPDFHALMARHRSRPGRLALPVQYVAFDVLTLGNNSLLRAPLRERRALL